MILPRSTRISQATLDIVLNDVYKQTTKLSKAIPDL